MDMVTRPATRPRDTRGACLALGLVVLLSGGTSWAATTPIYKCLDRNLGLLYTDVPCKDGEQIDVRAGDADPAAVARLDRERDALDQSFAQRIADERRQPVPVAIAAGMGYESTDDGGSYDGGPAYVTGLGFVSQPFLHQPMRPRHPKSSHPDQHFAPHPPLATPRR